MKPWEAMYRALVRRLDEIVENDESMEAVELVAKAHTGLMSEYDEAQQEPAAVLAEYSDKEAETLKAMERIANPTLPTDGNKITPGMLDSKADLQALLDGAEMFRTVSTVNPIDVNDCPGVRLGESDSVKPIPVTDNEVILGVLAMDAERNLHSKSQVE